jgi:hypothetical protein
MPSERPGSAGGDLLDLLPRSPDAYPQRLDLVAMAVLIVQLDAGAYRSASFLDDRILSPSVRGTWLPAARVVEAARLAANTHPLHFIFHTGHVGSTLVSRLLDETGAVLSLREPLPLRALADACDVLALPESLLSAAEFDLILATFMRLWSRGYAATRAVVVKATSSAGRLAVPILARAEQSCAIYMNLRAEPYLATLLAGQNSPIDLRGHGPERMRRLRSRITVPLSPLHTLSLGELAAMSWLVESLAQRDSLQRFAGRVLALDFDSFLSAVEDGLARILGHFGLPNDAQHVAELATSPVLTRYSKAPEHAYTPGVRAEVLRDSRRNNMEQIRKGMAWLQRLARSDELVAGTVNGLGY